MAIDDLKEKANDKVKEVQEKANDKVKEVQEKANDKVKEIQEKAKGIQKDIEDLKKKILSKEERETRLNEIKEKVKNLNEELKEQTDTLKSNVTEKVQATLDLLNEQINLGTAVLKNSTSTEGAETPAEGGAEGEKKGFFKGIGDRFSEKWENFKNKDTKDKAKTVGWLAAGSLATRGIFSFFSEEARARRRQRREAKREARRAAREARRKEIDELPFWQRPFGRILKGTLIGAAVVGGVYGIKKGLDKLGENSVDKKLGKLSGFESDCQSLKSQAENCLKLSQIVGTDYVNNKNEYDRILSDALSKQSEAEKIFIELSKSKASDEIKAQSQSLKNNIDDYVDEIKAMKDEIYATVPDGDDGNNNGGNGGDNGNGNGNNNREGNGGSGGEEAPEGEGTSYELKPVSADVVSQAAIDYIDTKVKALTLNASTKNKVKATLNRYFTSYPLLKKGNDNKMVFEISNKVEFGKTIKQLWDDIAPQLGSIKRRVAQSFLGDKLNNIDKTMKDLNTKAYENVVFDYFGGVIKNVVKKEGGTMTVQSYYDGISKAYPNKNASQVTSDIRGQANKDIKDLRYPLT